jgi:hypothetical protein
MTDAKSPILQGTLDLMVLTTLAPLGPLHGYGIARRIEQVGQDALIVNQGTIYLCLVRLVQTRWIKPEWGTFGQQPEGEGLFDHHVRPKAAASRSRELGAYFRRDRQGAAARHWDLNVRALMAGYRARRGSRSIQRLSHTVMALLSV